MALEKIEHIKKIMSLHLEIPLERITNETEITDPDGLAINLHMTKGWHIKTPDRSGDYFALQSKPFTLKELIELNK